MNDAEIARAVFEVKTGPATGTRIPVQFNPSKLSQSVTNTLGQQGTNTESRQFIGRSSARLSMELMYDTTGDGEDVRVYTGAIAALMKPIAGQDSDAAKQTAPVVSFEWGRYVFNGMLDSFQETIDFFSADGVPLRSTIQIALVSQEPIAEVESGAGSGGAVVVPLGAGDSAFSLSARAGVPGAAISLAAANGQASVRFGAGAGLAIGGSAEPRGPVAFASGGASAGFGIGLSAGAGVSAGAGFGVSAGFSAGASASAGAGFGARASASAGVSASAGAFGELRASSASRVSATARIDPARLVGRAEFATPATDQGASFAIGGKASAGGSASLRANVGGSLRARLEFDD